METCFLSNNEITQNLMESFSYYESNQILIKNYPYEFITHRHYFIEWLIFLNKNLSFKNETLFRAVTLFDLYISKIKSFNPLEIKLALIACLNISTKLEEVNVNFLNFFSERCLNDDNEYQQYTNIDLAKKEIDVLKSLNFKTNYSTPYDFLSIFHHLCKNIFQTDDTKLNFIINLSEDILIKLLNDPNYLYLLPKQIALYAINQTLSQFIMYNNSYEISNVIWCSILSSFDFGNGSNNTINPIKKSKQCVSKRKNYSIQRNRTFTASSPLKIEAM